MSKALVTSKSFNPEEIQLLRETYAKDLDDTQVRVFLKQAEAMDLNPFTKEIYGVKVGGRLVLMTSIEGRRKIAHKTGKYLGCKVKIEYGKDDRILFATATVKKLVGNHVAEFEAVCMFDEFDQKRDNWVKMPHVMISKVAEANALRMAFPNMEQLFDEAERAEVEIAHEPVYDVMPTHEHESQELPMIEGPIDPGEYVVKMGSRKKNPTKIKDMPRAELEEFIKWASSEDKLTDQVKEYFLNAVAFCNN